MIDPEVARLRRLRDVALRSRAIAGMLSVRGSSPIDPLLMRAACACWRVVRAASGRLVAHPYVGYQRGPSLASVLKHALRARLIALTHRRRSSAVGRCQQELRVLGRMLDDVRAVTLTPHLSDALGRSQWEIVGLLNELERESLSGAAEPRPAALVARVEPSRTEIPDALGSDWPYLAF